MNAPAMIPASHAQPHPLEALLGQFDRQAIGTAVEVLIALLDAADGEPDLEDATDLEDDFALSTMALGFAANGPGCEIADPDSAVDDSPVDEAEEGDREEDHASSMPLPSYGADQRAVMGRAGRIAFLHE